MLNVRVHLNYMLMSIDMYSCGLLSLGFVQLEFKTKEVYITRGIFSYFWKFTAIF